MNRPSRTLSRLFGWCRNEMPRCQDIKAPSPKPGPCSKMAQAGALGRVAAPLAKPASRRYKGPQDMDVRIWLYMATHRMPAT